MEQEPYDRLSTRDESFLFAAKGLGITWIARCLDMTLLGFTEEPVTSIFGWVYPGADNPPIIMGDMETLTCLGLHQKINVEYALKKIDRMFGRAVLIKYETKEGEPVCPYCSTDAFERVGIYGPKAFSAYHVYLPGRTGDIPKAEHFRFCPMCARKLIEDEEEE